MEHMQDKEFDRLVREKLEGLNPSVPPALWGKIEAGLKTEVSPARTEKKRGSGLPLWPGLAASLLLLGFGWWIYRPAKVVYLKGPGQTTAIRPAVSTSTAVDAAAEKASMLPAKNSKSQLLNLADSRSPVRRRTGMESREGLSKEKVTMPGEEPEAPPAAAYPQLARVSLQRIVSAEDKPIARQHLENVSLLATSDIAASEETSSSETATDQRSFGVSSILNFVVKSVDPGEKKVVTFTEDREGTLNIGFNKFFASRKKSNN